MFISSTAAFSGSGKVYTASMGLLAGFSKTWVTVTRAMNPLTAPRTSVCFSGQNDSPGTPIICMEPEVGVCGEAWTTRHRGENRTNKSKEKIRSAGPQTRCDTSTSPFGLEPGAIRNVALLLTILLGGSFNY